MSIDKEKSTGNWLGKASLNMTSEAQMKKKIGKMEFSIFKTFVLQRATKKVERKATKWEILKIMYLARE